MTLKEAARYEMAREGKISAVKIEQRRNNNIIQEFLGHKSSKTTEIYTHVNTKNLSTVKSPLDDILKEDET